jgi:hypothetical protein
MFHSYGDVTIADEGLQKLCAQSLWEEEIYIVQHLLWHSDSLFPVYSVASEDLFKPGSSRNCEEKWKYMYLKYNGSPRLF